MWVRWATVGLERTVVSVHDGHEGMKPGQELGGSVHNFEMLVSRSKERDVPGGNTICSCSKSSTPPTIRCSGII